MENINNIDNKEKYEIIKSEIVSPLDACTCTGNCGSSFGNGGF